MQTIHGKNQDYILKQLLGQGQFGSVFRGSTQPAHSEVAIKVIRRSKFLRNQKLKILIDREIKVLSQFNHDNVIKFHEIINDKKDVFLVYQYCQGGTLQSRITLNEAQLIPIFQQILQALSKAQKLGIIHRDIKPANILFKQGKIKVADWGFSRLLANGQTTCSFIGSPAYMAPQVLKNEEYSLKADIWSLGIVLFEALTGNCPWTSNNISSLYSQVVKKPIQFPEQNKVSQSFKNIIRSMLTISSSQRPSCQILKNKLQLMIHKRPQKLYRLQNSQQHIKIMGCVFFLQIVQWGRRQINDNVKLLFFIRLVQQNLLKLKPINQVQAQISSIWHKQYKVISQIKRKLESKHSNRKMSSRNQTIKTNQSEENPQSSWQFLIKQTIKYIIEELQYCYKQINKKTKTLLQLNLLLDLIIFQDMQQEYLKDTVNKYLQQLQNYNKKTLLKLLNYKLLLINKKYYH